MFSSSSWASIQSIRYSTYFGAETSIGLLILTPSAHLYSYLPMPRFHFSSIGQFAVRCFYNDDRFVLKLVVWLYLWVRRRKILYFGPADMVGQVAGVQNSIRVPYRMFIWLKKSTAAITKEARQVSNWYTAKQSGMPSTLQDTYERAIATNKNSAGSMVVQMTEHDHKDRLETCSY